MCLILCYFVLMFVLDKKYVSKLLKKMYLVCICRYYMRCKYISFGIYVIIVYVISE